MGRQPLFSKKSHQEKGVIASLQRTWSEGAHDTEIRGGLTSFQPKEYSEATKTNYMFDMKGKKILLLSARKIPVMFEEFQEKNAASIVRCGLYYSPSSKSCPSFSYGKTRCCGGTISQSCH